MFFCSFIIVQGGPRLYLWQTIGYIYHGCHTLKLVHIFYRKIEAGPNDNFKP